MAEGDRATVGSDARGVQAGLLDYRERLRAESFVEFDHGDIVQRQAGELQRIWNRKDGADAELLGRTSSRGVSNEACKRLEAERVRASFAHDHRGGGAVAHGGTVSRCNRAFRVERRF